MQAATRRRRRTAAAVSEAAASRDALLEAALAAFFEQGFHATSMRAIATRAGTAISHAYYYFPSKAEMLKTLMLRVTEDLILAQATALDAAGDDPADRLAALVRVHVRFHTERQAESFVGNTELRSLTARDRAEVVTLRDRVSAPIKATVEAGRKAGLFQCPHPGSAVLAIASMCTAVAGWYREGGPQTPDTIADQYAGLALRMVGCTAENANA